MYISAHIAHISHTYRTHTDAHVGMVSIRGASGRTWPAAHIRGLPVAPSLHTEEYVWCPSDHSRVPIFAQTRCTRQRQTEENVSSVCNEGEFGQQSMCRAEWQRPIGYL